MYEIHLSKTYRKQYNKLSKKDKDLTDNIIQRLANNEILESKYLDHPLHGKLKDYRDCHIKNDLVLTYKKDKNILTLTCVNVANHSNSFKK